MFITLALTIVSLTRTQNIRFGFIIAIIYYAGKIIYLYVQKKEVAFFNVSMFLFFIGLLLIISYKKHDS